MFCGYERRYQKLYESWERVNCRSVVKEHTLESKQMGRRENKWINIEGRVQFDLYLVRKFVRRFSECQYLV